MAFDFPASPTVGQAYTLAGVSYVWNGYAWMQAGEPMVQGVQYPAHGGIEMYWISNTSIGIRPKNGNRLIIDGISRPVTAVVKPSTFFTINIMSFVYAFWTGTAMDYEASTTVGPVLHTDGVKIKTGDPSRTFIGVLFRHSSGNIYDQSDIRYLLNEFNRQPKVIECTHAAAGVASNSVVAIGAVAVFLMHPGDILLSFQMGYITGNVADYIFTAPLVDGVIGTIVGDDVRVGGYHASGGFKWISPTTYAVHTLQASGRNSGASTATLTGQTVGIIQG